MILRDVQSREIVIVVLDLGTLVDIKAHTRENLDHLLLYERYRVKIARSAFQRGHCNVHSLALVATLQLALLYLRLFGLIQLLCPHAHVIHSLAEQRLLLGRNALHFLHQSRDNSRFSEIALPEFRQLSAVLDIGDLRFYLLLDLTEIFHSIPFRPKTKIPSQKWDGIIIRGTTQIRSERSALENLNAVNTALLTFSQATPMLKFTPRPTERSQPIDAHSLKSDFRNATYTYSQSLNAL